MNCEYEKQLNITENVTAGGVLKTSELFRLFQGISEEHVRLLGLGESEDFMRGKFWAVTNYRAEIKRMPAEGERVLLKTAALRSVHMIFPRCFRLYSESGELLCECSSRWVVVDSLKRSAVTLEMPENPMFSEDPCGWDMPAAGAVRQAETTLEESFAPPCDYYDKNGHMNNAAYFDMAEALLKGRAFGKTPSFLQIEYRSELASGGSMSVGIGEYPAEDGASGFFLCGKSGGKTIFRMKAEYRE